MQQRMLGDGLRVSALGLGCMPMVGAGAIHYGAATEAESIATIQRAIDLGITFFDTAEIYGPHTNEELLGRAIRGRRDELVIATKFGFRVETFTIDSSPDVPIPGSKRRATLEDSARAVDLALSAAELARLDAAAPPGATAGARYGEYFMNMLDR